MKRIRCSLLCFSLLLCFIVTGCSGKKHGGFTDLYIDVGMQYVSKINEMTFDEAKEIANSCDYDVKIDDNLISIQDENKNEISIHFYDGILGSFDYFSLEEGKSFWVSSISISVVDYGDSDKTVSSLADCESFLFGETSGINVTKDILKGRKSSSQGTTESVKEEPPVSEPELSDRITLRHGTLLDKKVVGTSLIIKAKIEPSYSNKATINQNYYNIEDIITDQGGTKYTLIDYWAVADMTDGSERKVISFTVPSDVIKKIADRQIAANTLGDYVDDLYILPSLKD